MQRSFTFVLLLVVCLAALAAPMIGLAQDDVELPLAGHGPYVAGIRTLEFTDEAREGRPVTISLWYPAIMPDELQGEIDRLQTSYQAEPDIPFDLSGAPYPLVLYSHGYAGNRNQMRFIVEPLVTHGFVVATVSHIGSQGALTLIDRPLDIRFVLDQLESLNASEDLAGLIDFEHVGLFGESDGAYTALTMTGARIDETFMARWGTGERDTGDMTDPRNWYFDWDWAMVKDYYDQFMPPGQGGLLLPLTDPRLDAIMAFLPCYAYIFGEQGLNAATVPTLLIGADHDILCPYGLDAAVAQSYLGSDHHLLTLVNGHHDMPRGVHKPAVVHFTAAFFAYYLRGDETAGAYLNAQYVSQFDRLAWDVASPQD